MQYSFKMKLPVSMPDSTNRRLAVVLAVVSGVVLLLFVITAALRVRAPFELEQHEGYMVQSVMHLMHGGRLYQQPDFTFLANMYPPAFYSAALAVGKLAGGVTFTTLRLVSIASTLASFGLIFLLVYGETRRGLAALAAAALYAGAYPLCEGWFDLTRLDSFYVFTVLLALWCTRSLPQPLAALAWVLAVQTKQPILPVAVLLLCYDYCNVRRTVAGLVTFFAGLGLSVFWLNHTTGGWYSLYIFKEPKANANLLLRPGFLFPSEMMLRPFALACLVVGVAIVFTRPHWSSAATRFYATTASILLLTWYQMMHNGSAANILMPAYAVLAIFFGLALARLLIVAASASSTSAVTVVLAAALIQVAAGIYSPGAYRPLSARAQGADALVARLRAVPGDVYVPAHPIYGVMAGKAEHPDTSSLEDTMRAMDPASARTLRQGIAADLCTGRIAALAFDSRNDFVALGNLLQLDPGWRDRFSEPQLIGTEQVYQIPSWIMVAKLDGALRPPCNAR